jgi:hypothetical protein
MSKVGKHPFWRQDDVIKNSNKNYASFSDPHCFEAILRLEALRLRNYRCIIMKDNRFRFQKIYRKSQIFYFFLKKIAIEVECFLQNFTKNHEIYNA